MIIHYFATSRSFFDYLAGRRKPEVVSIAKFSKSFKSFDSLLAEKRIYIVIYKIIRNNASNLILFSYLAGRQFLR